MTETKRYIPYLAAFILVLFLNKIEVYYIVPSIRGIEFNWSFQALFLGIFESIFLFSVIYLFSFFGRITFLLYLLQFVIVFFDYIGGHYFNFVGDLPTYHSLLYTTGATLADTLDFTHEVVPIYILLSEIILSFVLLIFLQKYFNKIIPSIKKVIIVTSLFVFIFTSYYSLYLFKKIETPKTTHLTRNIVNSILFSYLIEKYYHMNIKERYDKIAFKELRNSLYNVNHYHTDEHTLFRKDINFIPPSKSVIDKPDQYNVVLLVMESISSYPLGKKLNGVVIGESLSQLEKESLSFQSLYSNGHVSARGYEALFYSSIPPIMSLLYRDDWKVFSNNSLTDILKNNQYNTACFTSADEDWVGSKEMFDRIRFDYFYGPKNYAAQHSLNEEVKELKSVFRFPDHLILDKAYNYLEQYNKKEPFFLSFISIVSHFPYKHFPKGVVKKIYENPKNSNEHYINSYHYTTEAIAQFIHRCRKLPIFDKTLFVVISDHWARGPEYRAFGIPVKEIDRGLIPFFIYNPKIIKKNKPIEERRGSQIDFTPTLLNLLGLKEGLTMFMGQSLVQDSFYKNRFIFLPDLEATWYKNIFITPHSVQLKKENGKVINNYNKLNIKEFLAMKETLKVYEIYYQKYLSKEEITLSLTD